MKTFRMIGMALFAVLACVNFTSCDKEEEETATIYGEWRVVSREYSRYKDGELVAHELDNDWDEYSIIFRFNEDGTYYRMEGDSEAISEDEGTYTYKDGILTNFGEDLVKVTTLTSSTMVWESTYISDSNEYKEIYKYTFKRVK